MTTAPHTRARRLQGHNNDLALGAVAILVVAVLVFISYNANQGLPFVPTYRVSVLLPDALELTKGDDVRIGGGRVGEVTTVTAEPGGSHGRPYARVALALDGRLVHLPLDTTVEVRPASILGAKYVALLPGHDRRTLAPGGVLGLSHVRPVVEINDFLGIFDPTTNAHIQSTIGGFGDAVAGRGSALNATIGSTADLLGPLIDVSRVLASPTTDLAGFIQGVAATSEALAQVAPDLGSVVDNLDTTLAAVDAVDPSLGQALDELPGTEAAGTRTARDALPALGDALALTRGLRAGSALLPTATRRLATAVQAGTTTLRPSAGVPDVARTLSSALAHLAAQATTLSGATSLLTRTVSSLDSSLPTLTYAQAVCNTGGIWARNIDSTITQGDADGAWFRGLLVAGAPGMQQEATPESNLHLNYYPNEDAAECEAGNEPYLPGQQIGNPPGNQSTTVDHTAPPAGATALAAQAGLLSPTPGASAP